MKAGDAMKARAGGRGAGMIPRILISLLAGAAAGALLLGWRHFPVAHAFLVAVAVAALTYSAIGTAGRLRNLWRR